MNSVVYFYSGVCVRVCVYALHYYFIILVMPTDIMIQYKGMLNANSFNMELLIYICPPSNITCVLQITMCVLGLSFSLPLFFLPFCSCVHSLLSAKLKEVPHNA